MLAKNNIFFGSHLTVLSKKTLSAFTLNWDKRVPDIKQTDLQVKYSLNSQTVLENFSNSRSFFTSFWFFKIVFEPLNDV